MGVSGFFWNAAILGICLHGLVETLSLPLPVQLEAGGQFQFLTNTLLLATVVYAAFAAITSLFELLGPEKARLGLLRATVFNLQAVVAGGYWLFTLLAPSLLNKGQFEVLWGLDCELHVIPYCYLLVEHYRCREPVLKWALSALTVVFLGVYWVAVELNTTVSFRKDGITKYPYPFLNGASLYERVQWQTAFAVVAVAHGLF